MITKNFRLNALANQFAAALYDHIATASGGDHFMIDAGGAPVRVAITDGAKTVRALVDGYVLEGLKENYPAGAWERFGVEYLSQLVTPDGLTDAGRSTWQSMVADMGATVGGNNAKH